MAEEKHEAASESREPAAINLSEDQIKSVVRTSRRLNRQLRVVFEQAKKYSFDTSSSPHFVGIPGTGPKEQELRAERVINSVRRVREGDVPIERVETIVAIVNRAVEVFGSPDKATEWLNTSIPSLGDTPMSLLRTVAGASQVENALAAIEVGNW